MNLKSLIAGLVLSASSIAAASPQVNVSARASWQFDGYAQQPALRGNRIDRRHATVASFRDSRGEHGKFNAMRNPTWSDLGSNPAVGAGNSGFTILGKLRQIQIKSVSGRLQLTQVAIKYLDGTVQSYALHLRSGVSDVITLDRSRAVNQIVVYSGERSNGVYGMIAR